MIALFLLLDVDLALHQAPPLVSAPGLLMRSPQDPTTVAKPPAPERRAEPEVHYRLNVGYGADSARATGASAITGFGDAKRTLFRSYMFGDAAFGSRGLPVASLDTYFAATYYYDFLGLEQNSPFTTVYDRKDSDARALLIRSAYAEIDTASQGGAPVFVRAGRQFRMGAGIAHFDGIVAGYDDSHVEASAFLGQRVALFVDERAGLVGGGALRGHAAMGTVPVDGALEVLSFEGDVYTDATLRAAGVRGQLVAGARLFGASISDLIGQGRLYVTRRVSLLADWQQKLGRSPVYDWVSGGEPGPDARARWPLRYFTLPEPQAFTHLRVAAALDPSSAVELLVSLAGHVVETSRPETDPWPARTGFDASFGEAAAMLDWRPGQGLSVLSGYRLRIWDRPEYQPRLDDPEMAGELRAQELLLDGRYSLGPRRLMITTGAFLRIADWQTPLAVVHGDVRTGLRFDVESWFLRRVRLKASYEIADPSPVLSPDVDTLQTVRVIAEAVF